MRLYIGYLLAGLLNFYLVMLYYGVSAGFASYMPILALVGAAVLFVMAAPILIYQPKAGLYVGLIGCLFLLPYSVSFIISMFEEASSSWLLVFLAALMVTPVSFSSYWTVKALLQANLSQHTFPSKPVVKFLLCVLPIFLCGSYIFSIREYLSWSMFSL